MSAFVADQVAHVSVQHGFLVPHRLDYSTSGAVVTPLSRSACRSADDALRSRRARKFYLALLRGHVQLHDPVLRVDRPVGEDAKEEWRGLRMSCAEGCLRPREAVTKMAVLSRGVYGGYPATKVSRRHQDLGNIGILARGIPPGPLGARDRSQAPTSRPLLLAGPQGGARLHLL